MKHSTIANTGVSGPKYTPGPWYAMRDVIYKDIGDYQYSIANAHQWSDETEPNARLIALAPELVEALRNLLSDATAADMDNSEWSGSLIEARTLLARVEEK